jgi:ferredoxin
MPLRTIIEIDEDLCDGCGACVPGCEEGALRIVDGKARLVAEVYCDGLGACLGECPTGALRLVEREAPEFDPAAVEAMLAAQGKPAPQAPKTIPCGCSAAVVEQFAPLRSPCQQANVPRAQTIAGSALTHWPVKIRLVPEDAPFLKGADILLLADCAAIASPELHERFLGGRVILSGCPKFDEMEAYLEKLSRLFSRNAPASVTVLEMEVPCCHGLHRLAAAALQRAEGEGGAPVPLVRVVLGRGGNVLGEETIDPRPRLQTA